jgi:hypothetical protein
MRKCIKPDGTVDKSRFDSKGNIHKLGKVAYNLKADLETFVIAFVNREGIKDIMMLIEECQALKENAMIAIACSMLAAVLGWTCGIEAIKKKAKRYFEKLFELAAIDDSVKK